MENKKTETEQEKYVEAFDMLAHELMGDFLESEFGMNVSEMEHDDMVELIYHENPETIVKFNIFLISCMVADLEDYESSLH
jgi:hypothetical protein